MIGLGVGNAGTNKAVRMRGEVTLAFSPYGEASESYVREARAGGHEVLLEVPMEPAAFPTDDPGAKALMTSLGPRQNIERLTWLMAQFAGYVGVIESYGGRFTDSAIHLEPSLPNKMCERFWTLPLELLESWLDGLENEGIALAPLTAVLARRAQATAE